MNNFNILNSSKIDIRSFFELYYGFQKDTNLVDFVNNLEIQFGSRFVWQDVSNRVLQECGVNLHQILRNENSELVTPKIIESAAKLNLSLNELLNAEINNSSN